MMKLIVGLGNPGCEYNNTRHNIGFMVVDNYLKFKGIDTKWTSKFDGLFLNTIINNEKVIFLKPQTFMNLSGNSVIKIVNYYNIDSDDILIISDDLDLKIGNYKLKSSGSSGGHNGLKSIESSIGTNQYKRLKVGISKDKNIETKDYVLGHFSPEEKNILKEEFIELNKVLDEYFCLKFDDLMSKYNRKNR